VATRAQQRRAAVFALYQDEVTGRPVADAIEDAAPFTRELVSGVEAHRDELDAEIAGLAKGWKFDRIASLEKSILRVALYELRHRDDIPDEVAIDEAVEAAKDLCSADAPGFVNGILGAVEREEVAS
jgi:transcription antitermination protein NusB